MINIYLGALSLTDKHTKVEILSRANPLSQIGAKLLHNIKVLEEGLRWGRPWKQVMPGERDMRGIEYSSISSSTTSSLIHQDQLSTISKQIKERIDGLTCTPSTKSKTHDDTNSRLKQWIRTLEFASKCSICLGLEVLIGLKFDRRNGLWAGLIIVISLDTRKRAVFAKFNARVQGTALGSVYGVISCFIFYHEGFKLLSLLPWIIFTSLLRCSNMYGQSGGVPAAIGAPVILGRDNYGALDAFVIVRLTEVFIGLFVLVEVLFQPVRAATLARNHVCLNILAMHDCMKGTRVLDLETLISELKDYVADAELEPDYWYLPFRASCYKKLILCLPNIHDMMYFVRYKSETHIGSKFMAEISNVLKLCKETLGSSCICLEKFSTSDAREVIEEEMEAGKLCKLDVLIPEHEWVSEHQQEEEEDGDSKIIKARMHGCLSAMGFCINSVMKEIKDIDICLREIDEWN